MAEEKETPPKYTEFDESADYGVMYDKINVKSLAFWTLMGIGILVIVVMGVIALYNYNKFQFQESLSVQSEFQDFERFRANQQAHLNTYGVIDEEAEIYHIPIDSAMDLIVNESE